MRNTCLLNLIPLTLCIAPAVCLAADLGEGIKSGSVWSLPFQEFQQTYLSGERARWVDAEKTTLRLPASGLTIGGLKSGETIIKWKDEKPVFIQMMVYNKGDDGPSDEDQFNGKVDSALAALSKAFETPGKPYKPKGKESAVKMKVWQWGWKHGSASLEASSSGSRSKQDFEGEFVRLRFTSQEAADDGGERVFRNDLKANVKKEGKRVVIENIPMVDQGEKGYCAVATAARIFGYYGSENVDQHELASIAGTSAGGGTNTRSMKEAIKNIGSKFHVRLRDIDDMAEVKDYQRLVKAYNKEARKLKKEGLDEGVHNFANFWDSADAEVLKAARVGKPADIERWMKPVRTWVSIGVPVLWSVQLGIVPEPMRISQLRGGHMRLIIGYDDEKKTILFSDSWGAMHTCKEMPMSDAAAITVSRSVMIPSR